MATINHLFIVTSLTDTHILEIPNGSLEVPPYSLIEIIPNDTGTEIEKIQCAYVFGTEDTDSLYRSYDKPKIYDMIHPGTGRARNLLSKIMACIEAMDEELTQSVVNQFITGVAVTMFAYNIGRYDACDVGDPYYPIEVSLPDEARATDSDVEMLTESMFEQYSQAAKIVLFTDIMCIGKQWAKEIITFWNDWGSCFKAGTCCESTSTMYKAMSSCLQYTIASKQHQQHCHQNSHIYKTLENHAQCQISRMCTASEKLESNMETIVDRHSEKLKQVFEELVTELDDCRVTSFDDVTRQSELALHAISKLVTEAKSKLMDNEATMKAKLQSHLSLHVAEVIREAECELDSIMKKLVDEKLDDYIDCAVGRVKNPMSATMVEMSAILENCRKLSSESKRSATDARSSANIVKTTVTRRVQRSGKTLPTTPDNYALRSKISELEARLKQLERFNLENMAEQINRINGILRL